MKTQKRNCPSFLLFINPYFPQFVTYFIATKLTVIIVTFRIPCV